MEAEKEAEISAPIVLNHIGDTLVPIITDGTEGVEHIYEDFVLRSNKQVGIHDLCRGYLHVCVVSPKFFVIYCKSCNLRVPFPIEVVTMQDLRRNCAQREQLRAVQAARAGIDAVRYR